MVDLDEVLENVDGPNGEYFDLSSQEANLIHASPESQDSSTPTSMVSSLLSPSSQVEHEDGLWTPASSVGPLDDEEGISRPSQKLRGGDLSVQNWLGLQGVDASFFEQDGVNGAEQSHAEGYEFDVETKQLLDDYEDGSSTPTPGPSTDFDDPFKYVETTIEANPYSDQHDLYSYAPPVETVDPSFFTVDPKDQVASTLPPPSLDSNDSHCFTVSAPRTNVQVLRKYRTADALMNLGKGGWFGAERGNLGETSRFVGSVDLRPHDDNAAFLSWVEETMNGKKETGKNSGRVAYPIRAAAGLW